MKSSVRNREGVTIIDLQGKITIGEGDVMLRDAVHEAVEAGSSKILLNMKKASKMDSSGMGELIAAQEKVKASGGMLRLLNLPENILNVLGVTQLITVFDVFDDEDEAVASFN
ncbi:MAG: STAS domain-containing protein [Thermoanaerobaculia bacterium]